MTAGSHHTTESRLDPTARLVTFGHGTASETQILALLQGADIRSIVDVRRHPGSKTHPHVLRERLAQWLPDNGIEYRWDVRLGGRRTLPAHSPDWAWRHRAFRAYAAHMRSPEFGDAIEELISGSLPAKAVMCGESLWWKCHRRMIADFVWLSLEIPVWHLMHDGRLMPHHPIDGARVSDDKLLYYDNG